MSARPRIWLLTLISVSLMTGCVSADPVLRAKEEKRTCLSYGYKEGSQKLADCQLAIAENHRIRERMLQAEIGAAVIGSVAAVGAAAIVASQPTYYRPYPYFYRCNYWGCW